MRRHLTENNVYRWAANILDDMRELRVESAEPANLGPTTGSAGPEAVPASDGFGYGRGAA
jgi:hypothetical protein